MGFREDEHGSIRVCNLPANSPRADLVRDFVRDLERAEPAVREGG